MSQKPTYEELQHRVQDLEKVASDRKRAEQMLRESKEHLGSIFRSAPIGIGLVINRELQQVNSRLCEILGYKEEELVGRSSRILYASSEDFEIVGREKYIQIRDRGTGTVETQWQRKNGTIIDVLLSSTPIDLKDHSKGITFTALDITERKRAEGYLKNFQKIISSTQDGIALIHANYRYILVNKAYKTIFGIKEENFIGRTIAEFLGEHVFESIVKPNIDRCLQGEKISYQDWFDYPVLGRRWVEITYLPYRDEHDHIVGIVANTRDITQQHQAQKALEQSEKKYRDLFELNQDAITIFRIGADGVAAAFLDMNQAALTLGGYSEAEFFNLKPSDFETGVSKETIQTRLAEIASKGHAHFETVIFNKNREEIPVEIQVRQIQYMGSPAMMNIARDIRNRKHIENALRESEERFRTLATLAPVGISLMSPDGNCRYANPKWCEIAGLPVEQVLGRGWGQGLHPDDREMVFSGWQQMVEAKSRWEMEYRCKTSEGKTTWVYGLAVPQQDESGKILGYVGISTDITELKNTKERHRSIIQTALDGFWLTDIHGQLLEVNDAYCRMSGYCEDELLSMCIADVEAIESPQDVHMHIQEVVEKGAVRFETRHRRKDGFVFEVEISVQFRNEEDGRCVCFLRDISERKEAEQELRESEEYFRSLAESSPDYIMRYDRECRHTYMNPAALAVSGVTEADIIGKTHLDCGFPEDLSRLWEDKITQVFETGRPSQSDFSWESVHGMVHLDWRLTPEFDAKKQVMSVLGVSRDITERKQADEQLRELEERFRLTFYTSPDAVNINKIDGTYLEINEGFIQMTGYTRKDAIGKTSADINIWDIPEDRERLVEGLQRDGIVRNLESRFRMKDGSYKIALMSATIIQLKGEPHVLSITRDITDFKKAEEDKLNLERQLQQAQKMESVGRLAGGVAHDFNNMLSVILGHAELAMEGLDPSQPIFADLQQIKRAADRSTDITRQLLAFARKQIVAPKIVDLNENVAGMLKMLLRLIGEDIDLTWQPGKGLWPIKIDPSQIDQILANLCVNARDAVAGVGKITVATGNCTLDEEYCSANGFSPGQYVKIEVSDNGSGMDKETVHHIFEPFFTTKSVNEGTGLGLATIYGIVKQNYGFVNVYSELGQGTTFTIYLPRHGGTTSQKQLESTVEAALRGNESILLVEDEPTILNMTTAMLQRLGYKVLIAGTPSAAIRLADDHSGDIHLLLTDVIMPEMHGRLLKEKLLINRPELKCLFMSGYTANVISHHGVLDDGVYFIQKPFTKKDLAAKIRQALGGE